MMMRLYERIRVVVLDENTVEVYNIRSKKPFGTTTKTVVKSWLKINRYQPTQENQELEGIWKQPDNQLARDIRAIVKSRPRSLVEHNPSIDRYPWQDS